MESNRDRYITAEPAELKGVPLRTDLVDILACPACRDPQPLKLTGSTDAAGDVVSGKLSCRSCGASYPISGGVPRFVRPEQNYCANFGFQWQKWRTLQIDRLSDHDLSESRFLADSRWPRDWLKGKVILDAGCGAGRFSDVARAHGAHVVAVDISSAIDACRETTSEADDGSSGRVDCIQASLFDLPLKPGVFDAVYCMGVIQHTPDPAKLMAALPAMLKHGGRLAYNFYEEGLWRRLQVIKYALRLVTPHLPVGFNLGLARFLVTLFFPFTRILSFVPKLRILSHFIPIASVHDPRLTVSQQYDWTLLDTFDWYGARFEKRQHHDRVADILTDAGLADVESAPGLAWGRRPDAG